LPSLPHRGGGVVGGEEGEFLGGELLVGAGGEDQAAFDVGVVGEELVEAPEAAGGAAFHLYAVDVSADFHQVVHLGGASPGLARPVVEVAAAGGEDFLAYELLGHRAAVDVQEIGGEFAVGAHAGQALPEPDVEADVPEVVREADMALDAGSADALADRE